MKSKLCILGNGFDLYHCISSGYYDFKKYLESKYSLSENDRLYDYHSQNDNIEIRSARFIYLIINDVSDNKWSNFEDILGNFNYVDIYKRYFSHNVVLDAEADCDNWANVSNNENIASEIKEYCRNIPTFFCDWIRKLEDDFVTKNDVNKILKSNVKSFIDRNNNSKYLIFNYTSVLENVYNVDEKYICHIHGDVNSDIIVGHGLSENRINELLERYLSELTGAEDYIEEIVLLLRKKSEKCLENNVDFFNQLGLLDEISVFGFSYSDVDEVYVREIVKHTNENTKWRNFVYDENPEEAKRIIKNKLSEYGFNGKLKFYVDEDFWKS